MIVASLFLTCLFQEPEIKSVNPPIEGFFDKTTSYHGILIRANKVVSDKAMIEAYHRIDMVVKNMPNVLTNLVQSKAGLDIIGKDQVTSDLPDYREMKGKPFQGKPGEKVQTVDERTRGFGGLRWSCGEENLLKLKEDRYFGRDICVHEFAHTILNYGVTKDIQLLVENQYKASLAKGLWKGAYSGVDKHEFFAELTMWYFGTHGDRPKGLGLPADGPEAFKKYDPDAFKLLEDLYSGRLKVQLRPKGRGN